MAKPPSSTPLGHHSFLHSSTSDLPEGAFIATGLSKVSDFAGFLDELHGSAEAPRLVRHVLLSDASLEDLENNFGFLQLPGKTTGHTSNTTSPQIDDTFDIAQVDWYFQGANLVPWEKDDIDTTDEEEDILSHNRKLRRRIARAVRDLPNVIERIFSCIAPTVETLSLLLYISPCFESEIYGRHYISPQNGYMETLDSFLWKKDILGERVQKYQFPNLSALTLRNALRLRDAREFTTSLSGSYESEEAPFPLLENLTHLHLAQDETFAGGKEAPSIASLRKSLPLLTHIRFTGSPQPRLFKDPPREVHEGWSKKMNDLLPIGWWDNILRGFNAYPDPPKLESLVPPNLQLFVHPNYSPKFTSTGGFCATPLVEYDIFRERLKVIEEERDNIHLVWTSEEDWNRKKTSAWGLTESLALFPVSRAVEDFRERIRAGEGEWRIVVPTSENRRRWW